MNSMNDLLAKFDAVEVKSVNLISEGDKLFCEKNQAAYEDAVTSYRELTGFWESMEKAQCDILGEPDREQNPIYFRYLSKESGAYIDADAVRKHIEKVHSDYLDRIVEYFSDSYRIGLNTGKIRRALLPKNPDYGAEEEDIAAYREKMEDLMLRYQDILDLIFQQTDGRSFPEQAMYELKSGCHKVGEPPKCLRCGKVLPPKISHCALSRYIDVQICPECGTEEAMLDWDGKALPLWNWHAAQNAEASAAPAEGEVTLMPTCGFSEVFEQPRREVWGHPNGFPMSELCYARADHDGYRWHTTWTRYQDLPKDAALIGEVDGLYGALLALPEFQTLHTLRKMCRNCAEIVAEEDPNTYNLFAETPRFHVWLRLITRERDYNLYCHYYYKAQLTYETAQEDNAR